jgi:anthranilate phosphoribosyltransferase
MLPQTLDLLEAFKSLPAEEQEAFLKEIQQAIQPVPKKVPDLPIISYGKGGDASRYRQKLNIQTEEEINEWVKSMRDEWDRGF